MSARVSSPVKKLTDKIALAQLAQIGGVTTTFMRQFIRETIAIIEAGLLRDGMVKIHNFGTFRLATTSSAVPEVVFQPAQNLRELVVRAFGPAVHTGSRISLPALLEKHLGEWAPASINPKAEPTFAKAAATAPVFEAFDISDVPPRFTFAESSEEETVLAPAPADVEISAKPSLYPSSRHDKPPNGETPQFAFAESPENAAPAFSAEFFKPRPPLSKPVTQSRRRPFAWRAAATAALVLLLLFLLPGRLGEKNKPVSNGISSPTARLVAPFNETTTPKRDASQLAPAAKTSAKPPPFFAGGRHRVIPDDNLWKISGHYYRDPYLWPTVYRANIDALPNPNILAQDQQLALPILYGPPDRLTSDDRRHLAESYFLLYRYYRTHEPALAPFALWAAVRYDAQIRSDYAAELRADDWAFLQAHGVARQVAER